MRERIPPHHKTLCEDRFGLCSHYSLADTVLTSHLLRTTQHGQNPKLPFLRNCKPIHRSPLTFGKGSQLNGFHLKPTNHINLPPLDLAEVARMDFATHHHQDSNSLVPFNVVIEVETLLVLRHRGQWGQLPGQNLIGSQTRIKR